MDGGGALGRDEILGAVANFVVSRSVTKEPFVAGVTSVPVSGKVLDSADFASMVDACLDGWITAGRFTTEFERSLARYVGARSSL